VTDLRYVFVCRVSRSLSRTYLDFQKYRNLKIKLFFRNDLYSRIAASGFVNLTHLEARSVSIQWTPDDLNSLICKRFRQSTKLMDMLGVDNRTSDKTLFGKLFPEQVDNGSRKPTTWNWMVSRISDGNGVMSPRNLIDLVNLAKQSQISKEQRQTKRTPKRPTLIESDSLKSALQGLSQKRVNDTLIAEIGEGSDYIERFRRGKAEYSRQALSALLNLSGPALNAIIDRLKGAGFLAEGAASLKVPMLYRAGLEITQGRANDDGDEEH